MNESTPPESTPKPEKGSSRIKLALGYSGLEVKPTVEGLENLPSMPCVVAVTHLSNVDMPQVALALTDKKKIGFVGYENPLLRVMGRENFFPIDRYRGKENGYDIMLKQLRKMQKGIVQEKRTMIIAAHNPTQDWQLPKKPGMGAVILAHMANVPIVPVTVDIESSVPVARPRDASRIKNIILGRRHNAKIIFSEPIQVLKISGEQLELAMKFYFSGKVNMSEEEIRSAKSVLAILNGEGKQIMMSLASKLTPEKRGEWDTGRTVT